MNEITIPNNWGVRPYQEPAWDAMAIEGKKRAVIVWPRRAGKDSVSLNFAAMQTQIEVGTYWHMAPTLKQVRKIVWQGIDKQGRKMIDQAFPPALRKKQNDQEMLIEMKNGSIWQCVGSDSYDSLVGTNVMGVVFSEYSISDPAAWDYIRPILAENGGWAIFIYTPRGKNHGHTLFKMAEGNPDWFAEILTVEDCAHITPQAIKEEIDAGMPEEMVEQEFYCSFSGGMAGAIYAKEMGKAEREGRICDLPHNPRLPTDTYWDLGIRGMAVWMVQQDGFKTRVIDYYESSDTNIVDTITYLKGAKPYIWRHHNFPHDIKTRSIGTGVKRRDIVADLGWYPTVVANIPLEDGIQATQVMLGSCWFDEDKTKRGVECLWNYMREYNDRLKMFADKPLHNWASHGSDAFRMLGVTYKDYEKPKDDWLKYHNTGKIRVKRALRN